MKNTKPIAATLALIAVFGVVMTGIALQPAEAQVETDTEMKETVIEGESLHGLVDNISGELSGEISWGMISDGAGEAKVEVRPAYSDENITDRTIDLDGSISGNTTFEGLEFRMVGNAFENEEQFHNREDGTTKEETLEYDVVVTIYDEDGDRAVQTTETHEVTVKITNMGGPDYVPGAEVDTELTGTVEMVPPEEVPEDWKKNQQYY